MVTLLALLTGSLLFCTGKKKWYLDYTAHFSKTPTFGGKKGLRCFHLQKTKHLKKYRSSNNFGPCIILRTELVLEIDIVISVVLGLDL